jgi:two-component system, response regulator YesN
MRMRNRMKKIQKVSGQKIIIRFLIPYIILMFITHAISLYTSYKTLDVMRSEAVAGNINALNQTKDLLERRFKEVDLFINQLLTTPRIQNFQSVKKPFEGVLTYQTIELLEEMYDYKKFNNFIYDYYLYYKNSDLVVSTNTTYKMSAFYSDVYGYKDMDVEEWKSLLIGTYHFRKVLPSQLMKVKNQTRSMMTYVSSMGLPFSSHGAAVVLINKEEIDKMLGSQSKSNDGWAYIAEENGEILTSISWNGEEIVSIDLPENRHQGMIKEKINSTDMIVTYTKSNYNGWVYVMVKPKSTVMNNVNDIQKTTIVSLILSVFIGAIIALYLANRNSKPLKSIVRHVLERFDTDTIQSKDAYGLIEGTISQLSSDNQELQKRIKEHKPILRFTIFDHLLKGEFTSEQEMKRMLNHTGISVTGNFYCVVIFYLKAEPTSEDNVLVQLDKERVLVKEVIRNVTLDLGYIHDLEEDQMAFLYIGESENFKECVDDLRGKMSQIENVLSNQLIIQSKIVIGGIYKDITGVSRSFEEARKTFRLSGFHNKTNILWYNDLPKGGKAYYYPAEVESRLINFVLAGDEIELSKLLKQLFQENFLDKQLSLPILQLFVYELMGTLMKLMEHLNRSSEKKDYLEAMIIQLESLTDLRETYLTIEQMYREICKEIDERKNSRNVSLRDTIKEYIQFSYHNPELGLTLAAEHFNMSEVYLSQFYKEQTGENFSDSIERVRMEHARKLLINDKLSVHEIASKVGYHSVNTFGRAFKRIHGLSATAYKKSRKVSLN